MSTPGMPVVIATEHERAVLALFVAQLKLPECRERCQIEFNTALASDQPVERVARRLSTCLTDRSPSPACTTLLQLIDSVNLPRHCWTRLPRYTNDWSRQKTPQPSATTYANSPG